MKANLARLGIRGFRPNLAQAASLLKALRALGHTGEHAAELRRDIDRLRFVEQQIKKIETTRAKRLAQASDQQRNATVRNAPRRRRASFRGRITELIAEIL